MHHQEKSVEREIHLLVINIFILLKYYMVHQRIILLYIFSSI